MRRRSTIATAFADCLCVRCPLSVPLPNSSSRPPMRQAMPTHFASKDAARPAGLLEQPALRLLGPDGRGRRLLTDDGGAAAGFAQEVRAWWPWGRRGRPTVRPHFTAGVLSSMTTFTGSEAIVTSLARAVPEL